MIENLKELIKLLQTIEKTFNKIPSINMPKKQAIQLFEERKVRTVWDDEYRRGLIKP